MMALAMLPPPMKAMDSEGVAGDNTEEVIKIAASGVAQNGKNTGRTTEGTHYIDTKRSRADPQALGDLKNICESLLTRPEA
jgi:hypothetical protein